MTSTYHGIKELFKNMLARSISVKMHQFNNLIWTNQSLNKPKSTTQHAKDLNPLGH